MADVRSQPHHLDHRPQRHAAATGKDTLFTQRGFTNSGGGPSASKVIAVLTGLPVGGTLFFLAGISLIGSIIGLCVCTPLFILFSPVLVPAMIAVGLAVFAFSASGVFGLTGLSALSYMVTGIRQVAAARGMPMQIDEAKRGMHDVAGYVGKKTEEVGQDVKKKAHEAK